MCAFNTKASSGGGTMANKDARIRGRSVLQPTCNSFHNSDSHNLLSKVSKKASPPPTASNYDGVRSIVKSRSPRPLAIKRGSDVNGLNSSAEKVTTTTPRGGTGNRGPSLERKKSKKSEHGVMSLSPARESSLRYSSSSIVEAPGSIAAERREQMALLQAQRKMRIAHYGRSKSAKFEAKVVPTEFLSANVILDGVEEKRCSFITPNSDPLYVAYHDEEWGVPVHEDNMLFELLVLSGAQVGSDWTSILKKRQEFRRAFSGFEAEIVANFNEKKMVSVSTDCGIELSRVRGIVDNSNRILEIKREMGSFEKYIWGFVNEKPICTNYKSCHKIPVKTSKSESISKDMVKRGFRFVGPTVVHSFMQAAGLTNDHLISCYRNLQCTLLASLSRTSPPARSNHNIGLQCSSTPIS